MKFVLSVWGTKKPPFYARMAVNWIVAPSARLEHATYCSASKRSNPLSYEGKQGDILTRLDTMVKSMEYFVSC